MATWTFENRWKIKGTLTVVTPLHIGSGKMTSRADLKADDQLVEINALTLDCQGKPCIPGSTLKGCIRAWLETRAETAHRNLIDEVFGKDATETDPGCGGKAEFWDARVQEESLQEGSKLPHWDKERQTGVEASVAINRLTRTARARKLFHQEVVPPGVAFGVEVTGQNMGKDEVALVLAGLRGFDGTDKGISLGADTASGKGRLRWENEHFGLFWMDQKHLADWLTKAGQPTAEDQPMAYGGMAPATNTQRAQIEKWANDFLSKAPVPSIAVELRLSFDGPFVVNDPPPPDPPSTPDNRKAAAHRPRKSHDGQVVLPAKSVRGVLRAQAERIIRTLGGPACRVDDPQDACGPVEEAEGLADLCLACKVFGAAGWKSPLEVSDFRRTGAPKIAEPFKQWFVAVDRFTGGAAHQLLFDTHSAYAPVFTGTLTLDLRRTEPWAVGLLALVIRDLIEGDLTFGWGSAKGYGSCRSAITCWTVSGVAEPEAARTLARKAGLDPNDPAGWVSMPDAIKRLVRACVEEFRTFVKKFAEGQGKVRITEEGEP